MSKSLRRLLLGVPLAMAGLLPLPARAQAYPIDCAILLCLAGGWPASAPCAAARAEFIRRITPWPIEPPLQIWLCPMGASGDASALQTPLARLIEVAMPVPGGGAAQSDPPALPLLPVQATGGADMSHDILDVIRSIRVWHIVYSQSEDHDGDCHRRDSSRLGTYSGEGAFSWSETAARSVPSPAGLRIPSGCQTYEFRAVFVDWRDHAGAYGFEEVRY